MSIPKAPEGNPAYFDEQTVYQELIRCSDKDPNSPYGFLYWMANYCEIFNNDERGWVKFVPWYSEKARENGYDDQYTVAHKLQTETRLICLKARQIGQTTLVIAFFLWEALFHPTAFVLLLSRGELEAKELLLRIKSMYARLPLWMKLKEELASSKTEWRLSNGSAVLSLSSRRGDSYSSTHCLIDEAALLYRSNTSLNQVLLNLAPTIGQKGKLFLISKTDKSRTASTFNAMYRASLANESDYAAAFVPYYVVPGRDEEWYQSQVADSKAIDNTFDYVYESYPETPEQALSPKSADKRLAYAWLQQCYVPLKPLNGQELLPEVPRVKIYKEPEVGAKYVVIADPSEGMSTSDPAGLTVLDVFTMEQMAVVNTQVEPAVQGGYMNHLGDYYNKASLMFELNQHGRALQLWLKENTTLPVLRGWARKESLRKVGWEQSAVSKALMYDTGAEALRTGIPIIHDTETLAQLASIEISTLKAPQGQHDDLAVVFILGIAAIKLCMKYSFRVDFMKIA